MRRPIGIHCYQGGHLLFIQEALYFFWLHCSTSENAFAEWTGSANRGLQSRLEKIACHGPSIIRTKDNMGTAEPNRVGKPRED